MKMIRIARTEIPAGREPGNDSVWVAGIRGQDTTTLSERTGRPANKEYNIIVYRYPDNNYGLIAFYGTIGGNLQTDWKGMFRERYSAEMVALDIMSSKYRKGYRRVNGVNRFIPGNQEVEAPVAPAPTPRPQARVNNTAPAAQPAPLPQVQPAAKMPEPTKEVKKEEPKKEEPKKRYIELDPRDEELIGSTQMKLVKTAQPQPNAPAGYKHTDYTEARDFLNQHDMAALNVGRDTVVAYKLQQRGNQWALLTQDVEAKDPQGMAVEVRAMNPRQMNLLGMYDQKEDALNASVQNIRMREEFRPPEPVEEPEEEAETPEQKAEKPEPPAPRIPRTQVDVGDGEELIGRSKLNWYKKSMSR